MSSARIVYDKEVVDKALAGMTSEDFDRFCEHVNDVFAKQGISNELFVRAVSDAPSAVGISFNKKVRFIIERFKDKDSENKKALLRGVVSFADERKIYVERMLTPASYPVPPLNPPCAKHEDRLVAPAFGDNGGKMLVSVDYVNEVCNMYFAHGRKVGSAIHKRSFKRGFVEGEKKVIGELLKLIEKKRANEELSEAAKSLAGLHHLHS